MILVTGSTGFIGRHLTARLLADNQQIRCLLPEDHSGDLPSSKPVEIVSGNLRDEETAFKAVSGVHTIIHLESAQWWGRANDLERVELVGTRNLVTAARSARVGRIITLSQLGASLSSAYTLLRIKGMVEEVTEDNRYDIGCIMGSGIGGIGSIFEAVKSFLERGAKAVSPLMVPMMLPDSPSSKVAMTYGLRGPNFAISTACATGNNSIGEGTEIIRRGGAKMILAGSAEAGLVEIAMASFNNMTAISRRNDEPQKASRPFDIDRDGFVVAEGAALIMLEDLEHAIARGAKIYAEILGYGQTCDAYHVTAPLETGEGAAKAMELALENAGLKPEDISYINAHGTSTPLNDKSETVAIKRALGETAYEIPISSTKSVTGHLMGAAGAVEAVFSIMALRDNFIPPTVNLDNQDPECDLNYTPNIGVKRELNTVMSNSFGFGGHNAVIIFGKYGQNGHTK